jgi:hypothetical protein
VRAREAISVKTGYRSMRKVRLCCKEGWQVAANLVILALLHARKNREEHKCEAGRKLRKEHIGHVRDKMFLT